MASRLFIISVGTSLISKVNELIAEKNCSGVSSRLPVRENDWLNNITQYVWSLNTCLNNINNKLPSLSAELSSLFKDSSYPQPTAADTFLLLHTATTMGEVCADRLAFLLQTKLANQVKVCCYKVPGLSEAQSNEFFSQGLPNLLAKLQQEISQAQKNEQEVILVPTGGYKAIIPYFVIMGLLYDCPCLYVYEDSDLVATLPPLPLHADLARWSSLEAVVETLSGKAKNEAEHFYIYQNLKPILQLLLQEENTSLKPSPLCQVLQEKVTAERRRSELEFRTHFSPLLDYLVKRERENRDDSLKQYFLRLAAIGPHIWKGDRVPEMADHALLHHADIFHLAERILLPIFYFYETKRDGKPFLAPEELFVLLGALHLHDCGHVVGKVDLENSGQHELLPTEIRDHHHVLGYLRLTEPDKHGGTGKWIHEALKDNTPTACKARGDNFWPTALQAIATVGLYHRKAMKLREESYYQFIAETDLAEIPCLNQFLNGKNLNISSTTLKKKRLPLLVCLLRIIDSLDEQASRTGGKEAVAFHLALLETEAQEEEDRAAGLGRALEALSQSPNNGLKECLDNMIKSLFSGYTGRESKQNSDTSSTDGSSPNAATRSKYTTDFWREFNRKVPAIINCNDNPLRPLALEYVKAKLRAEFKKFQKEPYGEKLPIEGIELTHKIDHHTITFTIDLRLEEGVGTCDEKRKGMLDSLKKEYEVTENINGENKYVVQEILAEYGIHLQYGNTSSLSNS